MPSFTHQLPVVPRIAEYEAFQKFRESVEAVTIKSRALGREVLVPCMNTLLVAPGLVVANDYNPNAVPPDRMSLLRESILSNGFCFPVVTIADDDRELFVVIDGFHRTLIGGGEWLDFDFIPVVVLTHDMAQRMLATMQFNKAKGFHQVDLDAELIVKLVQQGLGDEEIAARLKIDLDDVHRYRQVAGDIGLVATQFARTPYSLAWEIVDNDADDSGA